MTLNLTQRGKRCFLVWCLGWCCCIVVTFDMTQRGKHYRLTWRWIRPRSKLRWKYVKRWWKGCPGVVCTNGDRKKKRKKKSAFVRISVSVRWAHVRLVSFWLQYPGNGLSLFIYLFIFVTTRTRELFSFFSFSDTISARYISPCLIRP